MGKLSDGLPAFQSFFFGGQWIVQIVEQGQLKKREFELERDAKDFAEGERLRLESSLMQKASSVRPHKPQGARFPLAAFLRRRSASRLLALGASSNAKGLSTLLLRHSFIWLCSACTSGRVYLPSAGVAILMPLPVRPGAYWPTRPKCRAAASDKCLKFTQRKFNLVSIFRIIRVNALGFNRYHRAVCSRFDIAINQRSIEDGSRSSFPFGRPDQHPHLLYPGPSFRDEVAALTHPQHILLHAIAVPSD
jgi:hypothetical protein